MNSLTGLPLVLIGQDSGPASASLQVMSPRKNRDEHIKFEYQKSIVETTFTRDWRQGLRHHHDKVREASDAADAADEADIMTLQRQMGPRYLRAHEHTQNVIDVPPPMGPRQPRFDPTAAAKVKVANHSDFVLTRDVKYLVTRHNDHTASGTARSRVAPQPPRRKVAFTVSNHKTGAVTAGGF